MQEHEEQATTQAYTQRIFNLLQQTQQECRASSERVQDPKAQALFETVAEALGGAMKALEHFQQRSEGAWRSDQYPASQRSEAQPAPQGTQPPAVTDMVVDVSENEPPRKLYTE